MSNFPLQFKDNSIKLKDLQPQTVHAMMVVKDCYYYFLDDAQSAKFPFVVTSVNDGQHMQGSLHYKGCAFDMRTWAFAGAPEKLAQFKALCKKCLMQDFDVVIEGDHIHVEYDPKHTNVLNTSSYGVGDIPTAQANGSVSVPAGLSSSSPFRSIK